MLKIDGPEINMEGPFHQLVKEVARLVHTISKTGAEKFKEDTGSDSDGYTEVVELILDELAKLKKFDSGDIHQLPDDVAKDFDKQHRKELSQKPRREGFIDYDTSRLDTKKARNLISGIIKDTFKEDAKAETKAKKKRK